MTLLAWPSTCFRQEVVKHPRTRDMLFYAPSMFEDVDHDDQEALRSGRPERRKHRRFSTLKTGEMAFNDNRHSVACLILNLSYGGAEVRLPDENFDCPSTFALKLQSGPVHSCEVRWRRGDKVGVKFT